MMVYYALVVLLAILLGLCFIDLKGKVIYFPLLLLMYVLFAFMRSNVDMGAYLAYYENMHTLRDIGQTDPGFGLLMFLANRLGADYFTFLALLGIGGLIFLTVIFFRRSKIPAAVLALYFIFDYAAEIIQIRTFIGEAVLYILILNLVEEDEFNWRRFLVLLVIAILFHSTHVFFALLLLPLLLKSRKKLIVTVGAICLAVPMTAAILSLIPIPILREKLQYYVFGRRDSISLNSILYVVMYLGVTLFINSRRIREWDWIWRRRLDRLVDIHIVAMIACVLMLYFTSNFYRILRTVMVADFIVIGNYYWEKRKIRKQTQAVLAVGVFAFFIAYEIFLKVYYYVMLDNSVFAGLLNVPG